MKTKRKRRTKKVFDQKSFDELYEKLKPMQDPEITARIRKELNMPAGARLFRGFEIGDREYAERVKHGLICE